MPINLRRRLADIIDPGWRNSLLIASVLEHEARLRADPEHQRRKREIDRQFQREFALLSLGTTVALLCLVLGVICWQTDAPLLTIITWPTVQQIAGMVALSGAASFLLVVRPWR